MWVHSQYSTPDPTLAKRDSVLDSVGRPTAMEATTSWSCVAAVLVLTFSVAGGAVGPTPPGPHFVLEHSGNVTARVNGSVILNCRVRRLSSRQVVSWGRGFEVLTGGLMLFASDRRFQPLHQEYSEDWGLRILSVRLSDAGWYFCQISTSPPISHYLYLTVVEPQVEIVGGPEFFIHEGSTLNLTCVIRRAHKMPENVRWTHDSKLVQFDRSRAGVHVRTSYGLRRTVSTVLIRGAQPSDTGAYFCDPDGLDQAKVIVHVLAEEKPAARTTNGASSTGNQCSPLLVGFLIVAIRWLAAQKRIAVTR